MAIDFAINTQMPTMANAAATSARAEVSGSFMGSQAVMVESPLSLLADAAEELTFSADTTDEFELDERKEKDSCESALAERVKLYQDLMHEAGKSEELNRLKDSLRSREGREGAAREALSHFPDPSDAWAALSEAYEELKDDPSVPPAVVTALRQGLDELETLHGPQIRAGIQGALNAAGYAGLDSADNLRNLYRQTVCEFTDVTTVFAHIHAHYGEVSFDKAMDFLFSTLGHDLATDVPSMETTHLESVHTSLEQVRLLQSTHGQCERLMQRWENVHGVPDGLSSMELLGDLVKLRSEKFLGAVHIDAIAAKAKPPDIERQVLFLQELLNTTRTLPVLFFDGEQGRMTVLNAVQEAVDNAIQREDEYLASMGDGA